MSTTTVCRAKDPSTCAYHGAEQRMNDAATRRDFAAYEVARRELETAKKDEADWTTAEMTAQRKQTERLAAAGLPAGVFVTNNLGGTCFDAVTIEDEGSWLNCDPGIYTTEVSTVQRVGALKLNRGDVLVRRPLKTFTVPEGYRIKGFTELGGSKKYPTSYNAVNTGDRITRGSEGRWFADTIVLERV